MCLLSYLTFKFDSGFNPNPSFSKTDMNVRSKHMKGWSVFAVLQTAFAVFSNSPTVISPPKNGSTQIIKDL